jgi:PhnB protein
MSITTTAHLNFRGEARAALEFYRSVFGGEVAVFTYEQAHAAQDPQENDWLTWGEVRGENGIHVMAYDVQVRRAYDQGERSYFVSVRADSTDELADYWSRLVEGAQEIIDDLAPAPWGSPLYGQVKDRFGVIWVLDVVASW